MGQTISSTTPSPHNLEKVTAAQQPASFTHHLPPIPNLQGLSLLMGPQSCPRDQTCEQTLKGSRLKRKCVGRVTEATAPGKAKEVAMGGSGHEEGWGKPSVSSCTPGGVRAGVHSHHSLMSSVLQKLTPVLRNLGWISVKPSLVETGLSLGAGHSVQRKSLQGNKIFFPNHVLAPCHHAPPQNYTLLNQHRYPQGAVYD